MDCKHIHEMLKRYWLCETTMDEEMELRNFFSSEDIPIELVAYKGWFVEIGAAATSSLDNEFEHKILKRISVNEKPKIPKFYWWIGVASLLVIVFTYTLFIHSADNDSGMHTNYYIRQDTFDNPEDALDALYETLRFTLVTMGKGVDMAAKDLNQIELAFDIILVH